MPKHPDDDQAPTFHEWAANPDNVEESDALFAHFLADYGAEMMSELVDGARVRRLEKVAGDWIEKLKGYFDRWWQQGQPRLSIQPAVKITYPSHRMEQEAWDYLFARFPT